MKVCTLLLLAFTLIRTPAFAQPPVPQVEIGGTWVSQVHEDAQDRSLGPDAVDYLGLPLNAEGRARALRYSTSSLAVRERQCLYYPPTYVVIGPQGLRIWSDPDPLTGRVLAWNISGAVDRSPLKIWMDGRPHPSPNALHTFSGFTTGVWEGNTLTTYTTHFKEGYVRRNGAVTSDQTTLTMHLSRHGDVLTITGVIDDPIYLARPHIVSRSWRLNPNGYINTLAGGCVPDAEISEPASDDIVVPHYLPGQNPSLQETTRRYNIPLEAVMGGVETIYPEYRRKLKDGYVAPTTCTRYCCLLDGPAELAPGLRCIRDGAGTLSSP